MLVKSMLELSQAFNDAKIYVVLQESWPNWRGGRGRQVHEVHAFCTWQSAIAEIREIRSLGNWRGRELPGGGGQYWEIILTADRKHVDALLNG